MVEVVVDMEVVVVVEVVVMVVGATLGDMDFST